MSWSDLLKRGNRDSFLYEGVISQDAATATDRLLVTVLAHDQQQTFGPLPFMPRPDALPQDGDSCIVAFAATDNPGTPTGVIIWYEP